MSKTQTKFYHSFPQKVLTKLSLFTLSISLLAGTILTGQNIDYKSTDGLILTGNTNLEEVSFTNTGIERGQYTTLTFGPDGKLYGLTLLGEIHRWNVDEAGSFSNRQTLTGLTNAFGSRVSIGLAFDPNSTASNLIAYVTHSSIPDGERAADGGKLSKLSGVNLQNEQTILTNLPPSINDHIEVICQQNTTLLNNHSGDNLNTGEAFASQSRSADNRNSLSNDSKVSISPNPDRSELSFNLSPHTGKTASLILFDHSGKSLLEQKVETITSDLVTLNTNQIKNGLYYLIIQVNEEIVFSKKIIRHRVVG